MLLASAPDADPVWYAETLDVAAKAGVNHRRLPALVHKGFFRRGRAAHPQIPEALACTDYVCSSINVGSTKSGINMDAVKMMARHHGWQRTQDKMRAASLSYSATRWRTTSWRACSTARASRDCVIHVGVSGLGAWCACGAGPAVPARFAGHRGRAGSNARHSNHTQGQLCRATLPASGWQPLRHRGPLRSRPRPAIPWRIFWRRLGRRAGCCGTTATAGHAERRGKKGGGWPRTTWAGFPAFIPVSEDDGMIKAGARHRPLKAGSQDGRVQSGHRHGRHPGETGRRRHLGAHRGRGRHRHGEH